MIKRNGGSQRGFAHPFLLVFVVLVFVVVGLVGYRVLHEKNANTSAARSGNSSSPYQNNPQDANSTDPIMKGKFLSRGYCSGSGSRPLTHAPMAASDINNIQPMGLMVGGHVTPVDHEYYWGTDQNAPVNTYPVYADADGTVAVVQYANDGQKIAWWVTIAHSCTFLSNYNLLTSLAPTIKAKMTQGTGNNWEADPNIPIKAGDLIGYVGHQSLDYQVWDTTRTLKGLLHPVAYNNREPWKVNTVAPLDYFTAGVKAQILPKYMRIAQPQDGRIDYDISGAAVGNWFLSGSNGYAGGNNEGNPHYYGGHLALAYDYLDPAALVFSTGDYQGQPAQFAVVSGPDWKTVTPSSGVAKYGLGQLTYVTSSGSVWTGGFAQGVKVRAGYVQAIVLIQLTGAQDMKVEIFPGKNPSQVSGFDANAKSYNRGQDAQLIMGPSH